MRLARETSERIPLGSDMTVAVKSILDACEQQIHGAIGFDPGEFWAISIFQIQEVNGDLVMKRIAAQWANRDHNDDDGRNWQKGVGFTGVAWAREADVVESDVRLPEIAKHYPVPEDQQKPWDNERYVSVASIPIKVGKERKVWGAVTVTSDKADRFKSAPGNVRSQYVDTVRVLAGILALQVSFRDPDFISNNS